MDAQEQQEILNRFGSKLKEFRNLRNLSTRQLSDIAEVDPGNINEIENGKINPGLITMACLAAALEINISDFFD